MHVAQFLLLDIDNTLYAPSCGVIERVDALINRYLVERSASTRRRSTASAAACGATTAPRCTASYTSTASIPTDYLDFVHAIELADLLAVDPALAAMLGRIPLLKVAVTNGSAAHARGVLDCLGVRALFFRIYGLERLAFVPKPYRPGLPHRAGRPARGGARLHPGGGPCREPARRPPARHAHGVRRGRPGSRRRTPIVHIGSILELEGALAPLAAGSMSGEPVRALRTRSLVPARLPLLRLQRLRIVRAARGAVRRRRSPAELAARATCAPWQGRALRLRLSRRRHAVPLCRRTAVADAARRPPHAGSGSPPAPR